jgi:hypothetical protein
VANYREGVGNISQGIAFKSILGTVCFEEAQTINICTFKKKVSML